MPRDGIRLAWGARLAWGGYATLVGLLAVSAVGGACGRHSDEEPAPAIRTQPVAATVGELEIRRPLCFLFPGTGAVYLTVVDTGSRGDRLVRAEANVAAATETHETVDDGGVMRMIAHPDGFSVPPGGALELVPGGKHIMLVAPRLASNEARISIDLYFERAGHVSLDVPISTHVSATVVGQRFEEADA